MALSMTERAAQEVKTILEQQKLNTEKTFLRMGVKGGGCSGFTYSLDITESKSELDEEFDANGVKIVCDPKSYLYLNGTTLDFKDEIMGRGFVFNNPNANTSCGCGSSFTA
jgi:iron-sulfur cluster assembly protein